MHSKPRSARTPPGCLQREEANPWVDVPNGYTLGAAACRLICRSYFLSANAPRSILALSVGVKQQGGGWFVWCAGFFALGNASPAQLA